MPKKPILSTILLAVTKITFFPYEGDIKKFFTGNY